MIYLTSKELMAQIEHIIKLKSIPKKEIAQKMNVSQQTISKILGSNNPKYLTLLQLCEALDICMDIKFVDKKFALEKDDTI